MSFNIRCYKEADYCIIELSGSLDASNALLLDELIEDQKESALNKLLIDCGQLIYIGSAGLGVFLSHIKDLELRKIYFILYNMPAKLMDVFKMLALDEVLCIVGTKEEAVKLAKLPSVAVPPRPE